MLGILFIIILGTHMVQLYLLRDMQRLHCLRISHLEKLVYEAMLKLDTLTEIMLELDKLADEIKDKQ
jgi:hypothetical protein